MKTVQVQFYPNSRLYSYLCTDDVKVGDMVEIEARDGGTKILEVVAVKDGAAPEATKYASKAQTEDA